jgi:hypothetical protein
MQGSQSALNYQLQKMQADAAMQMQRGQNQSGFFGGLFGNLVGASPALLFGTQSPTGLLNLLGL